jgi:hypothetical protein
VTRLILIFLFQSKQESLNWLSPSFFAGPLISSLMLPVLYRGVSGTVFPSLVYDFWRRVFGDASQQRELVAALVPELFPSNPKFHHNVYAVPVLLDIVCSSKQKCLTSVREIGKILLLGRSHYCSDSAWKLVIECTDVELLGPVTAFELFARMHPHQVELVRDYSVLSRSFFALTNILSRVLPVEDPSAMACCVYGSSSPAQARQVLLQSSRIDTTLELLLEMCVGSFPKLRLLLCSPDEDLSLVLPAVVDSAVDFALRLRHDTLRWTALQEDLKSGDEEKSVASLMWMRCLTNPWYLEHCPDAQLDKTKAVESVPLIIRSFELRCESSINRRRLCLVQWSVLSQLVKWLSGCDVVKQIAKHAGVFLSTIENHVEFEALRHVFECCATAEDAFGEATTKGELLRALRLRFDEIVAEHESNRDAVSILTSWACIAFGGASRHLHLAPTCLEMLQTMELQHHRFHGVVEKVVERHFVPHWLGLKDGAMNRSDLDQDAELLLLLLRQGYERDDSRRLDQDGEDDKHRIAFSLPRAFAMAYLDVLSNDSTLATRVCLLLTRAALKVVKTVFLVFGFSQCEKKGKERARCWKRSRSCCYSVFWFSCSSLGHSHVASTGFRVR